MGETVTIDCPEVRPGQNHVKAARFPSQPFLHPHLNTGRLPPPASVLEPGLLVIIGPTASGKSALALRLATHLGLPILSADSRQVYRGMDIGTAKATAGERRRVRHHLLDLRNPDRPITVREFQQHARRCIAYYHRRGICPVLVGGSGLYVAAVTQGLTPPALPPQPELRQQLEALGSRHCYDLLRCADPEAAARIHSNDKVRLQRALEVIYGTGQPGFRQRRRHPPPYPVLELGLNPGDLEQRIARRTASMYASGLLAETRGLLERYGPDLPLLDTLGYGEARHVLTGQLQQSEAIATTNRRTRQYAKRQRTWFRGQHRAHWLSAEEAGAWAAWPEAVKTAITMVVGKRVNL